MPRFRLFAVFALSFLLGIGVASFVSFDFGRSWPIFVLAAVLFLFCAFINFWLRNFVLVIFSFAFIFSVIGLIFYARFDSVHQSKYMYGVTREISGKIVAKPEVTYSKQNVVLEIENHDRILVTLPHYPLVEYGNKIKLTGQIERPLSSGQVDYAKYLKRQLIFGVVNRGTDIQMLPSKPSLKEEIYGQLYKISDRFEASLNRLYPEPQASLANGLILGLKKNLPDDYMTALNATGLTHLVALSGYNITIIVCLFSALLLGYLSRRQVFWLGGFVVLLFVILTGAASSVVRAAIFSLLIIFGKTIGRRGDFTNLMLLAALVMVLWNPFVLRYDVGFQLSFLAFAGLIYISPVLGKFFAKEKYSFLPEAIKSPLTETLAAQIAVLPLIFSVFGRVSLIAPITNVVVLWIVPYAMAASFVSGLLGIIYYPFGKMTAFFTWPILEYIIKVPEFFAHIPLASVEFQKSYWYIELLMFMALTVALKVYYKKFRLSI